MTSNFQAPTVRHYIDLPREMSEKLSVAAAERRTSKKRIMEDLIVKFLTDVEKTRGKK